MFDLERCCRPPNQLSKALQPMMVTLMKDNAVKKDKEKESNAVKKTAMKKARKTAMKVMKAQKNNKAMMK